MVEMLKVYERRCPGCGLVKRVDLRGGVEARANSEFYIRRSHGATGARGASGWIAENICKVCKREAVEKRRVEGGVAVALARAEARRRWKERNAKSVKKSHLEYGRRRRGWVDPVPFVEWLREFVAARQGVLELVEAGKGSMKPVPVYRASTIAAAGGMKNAVVENMLRGSTPKRLLLKEVDAILTFCGAEYMLSILYPMSQGDLEEKSVGFSEGHVGIQEALGGAGEGKLAS